MGQQGNDIKANQYYAHKSENGRKQTLEAHLQGVADLCKQFAEVFNAGAYGYLAGIAHDIGKYSEGFQKRLEGGPKVDHSSAGAIECAKIGQELIGLCVAGHHGGLLNFGNAATDQPGDETYVGRLKRKIQTEHIEYPGWEGQLPQTPSFPEFEKKEFERSLWVRMIYSCLVDADFLDTEEFMNGGKKRKYEYDSIDKLKEKLDKYVSRWDNADRPIDKLRNQIRRDCVLAGEQEKGLFSLTVPTGGGKTVSSLAFALGHAMKYGMQRIIYVIPFTSIIEQNAAVFRDILGNNNVLEHHSEANGSNEEDLSEQQKWNELAAENWDAPIIVTTAVQFFESFYSNKSSKCRKLHNIANSIIVFDEAQSIPVGHLLPCMAVIGTLVKWFGVSAVLCSATQPYVSDLLLRYAQDFPIREICSDVNGIYEKLSRVKYHQSGMVSLREVADAVSEARQALCIVNARKTAKALYELLPKEDRFHLSTLMIPEDRSSALKEIRKRLQEGRACRVISTSLIEAGVDVDFPLVYREMTGLDSIVQAAGRCNREGKRSREESIVTVFQLDEPMPQMLRINIGAAREALSISADVGKRETVEKYFRAYRSLIGNENIDRSSAVAHLSHGISGCILPFKTVAEEFNLIDQNTKTVYILNEENKSLINAIRNGMADRITYRLAGHYSVNIYEDHYNKLLFAGDIEEIAMEAAVLANPKLYNKETGLSLIEDEGKAIII